MKYVVCVDKAEAEKIAEESYDLQCERLHCPTPKKERVTRCLGSILLDYDPKSEDTLTGEKELLSEKAELEIKDEHLVDIPLKYSAKVVDSSTLSSVQAIIKEK